MELGFPFLCSQNTLYYSDTKNLPIGWIVNKIIYTHLMVLPSKLFKVVANSVLILLKEIKVPCICILNIKQFAKIKSWKI